MAGTIDDVLAQAENLNAPAEEVAIVQDSLQGDAP